MDVNNPWQVVSIEAFYCLKCPECMYFTTDDNQFYNHAVENHPLSGVLFGKPKDETIDPEEILNLVVKNELPENSYENEDNENLSEKTFEAFAGDCNGQIDLVKSESYEPFSCIFCGESFSDLNNMKMHLKVHDKVVPDQRNILERESIENLTTLNQGRILYSQDFQPEIILKLTQQSGSRYGMPENSLEVKSDSIDTKGQENLYEKEKSEIDVRFTSNETEGIKIINAIKEHIEKLKNDKDKLSEFITTTNQILDKPDIERLGKKSKVECPSCLRILNKETFNKHVVNCELYQKLIKNKTQCRVCNKRFANSHAINGHIGHLHKKELLEIQKSLETFTSNEMDTMKNDIKKT